VRFAVFQQELQNPTVFDGFFIPIQYAIKIDFLRFQISEKNGQICGFH